MAYKVTVPQVTRRRDGETAARTLLPLADPQGGGGWCPGDGSDDAKWPTTQKWGLVVACRRPDPLEWPTAPCERDAASHCLPYDATFGRASQYFVRCLLSRPKD